MEKNKSYKLIFLALVGMVIPAVANIDITEPEKILTNYERDRRVSYADEAELSGALQRVLDKAKADYKSVSSQESAFLARGILAGAIPLGSDNDKYLALQLFIFMYNAEDLSSYPEKEKLEMEGLASQANWKIYHIENDTNAPEGSLPRPTFLGREYIGGHALSPFGADTDY